MKIGLIDVDGHHYPNIPLMIISAWHKTKGDTVEWYNPMFSGHCDIVYKSKVFSFTEDYQFPIDADKNIEGGTGYAITLVDGKEVYDKSKDPPLPNEIEHIYPDYTLYDECKDTAYGFLTRGCPRGCSFCHVAPKEGRCSHKVANLSEFWNGQKNIVLCDPNILACKDWKDLLQQLIDSGAMVDFNQGLDIRMMTAEKAQMLSQIKIKAIHFAWDRIEDKEVIQPKFKTFRAASKIHPHDLQVYVLVGDRESRVTENDLYRIEWLRDNGYAPFVMVYDKEHLQKGHELLKLQRWVNNRLIFWTVPTFKEYQSSFNNRKIISDNQTTLF